MSDTLADLSSLLPSEFFTADDIPITKTHFPNHLHHRSTSSTESESDDDELTHRFTRSVSLQERIQITYQKKRVFSSSPESTLNWNISSPVAHSDEDSWERIYAAAGEIARMKMEMNRSLLLHQRGPPPQQHRNCSNWMRENDEFFRQRQFHQRMNYAGVGGGRCGGPNRPVGFRQPAWPPQGENPRRQQPVFAGSGGGCGRPTTVVKKECAGTGVFLPRTGFSHGPPESKKKPACLGGHMPARIVAQSYNKTMGPMNQPNMYSGFTPHHINQAELAAEIVMARRNHAAMIAQQQQSRSTNHVGVPETKIMGPQDVVLPQEWTY